MSRAAAATGVAVHWRLRGVTLDLDRPILMGILNVTPDSFSDGGRHSSPAAAGRRVETMLREGAGIIDVGGESTRPGSEPVTVEEEWRRTAPAVRQALAAGAVVSIDTSKAAIARRALDEGVHLVNDITALGDPHMASVLTEFQAGAILMHLRGTPRTMQENPRYKDVVREVAAFLEQRRDRAVATGLPREAIALDPGIGFGKTLEHNLILLNNLDHLVGLGHPVVLGASRKRFIGEIAGVEEPTERVHGSLVAATHARRQGVQIFRIHDVNATRQALTVADALRSK